MKASLGYKETIQDMEKDVGRLSNFAAEQTRPVLDEIGKTISDIVKRTAPRSENDYYYSNGHKVKNTHIADDVIYKVKKSKRTGEQYVSVSGGKKTWAKWHLVNDGHVASNGNYVKGNYFVDKAEVRSETPVDDIVDDFLRRMVES